MRELLDHLDDPIPGEEGLCQGPMLSRSQFLPDLERGYRDARLIPDGTMTRDEIEVWTQAASDPAAFVLSPARCDGVRGRSILSDGSLSSMASRLRGEGAPLGEVFSFVSGLYFRGKLTYAQRFLPPTEGSPAILVIAPGFGLLSADRLVTLDDLRRMAATGVSEADPRFREPLERDGAALAAGLGPTDFVVLLGSIATGKYVGPLEHALGERLRFPVEFVGRGDMSRGGLMLRRASEGVPLSYVPVAGAVRRGPRPPRLEPLR